MDVYKLSDPRTHEVRYVGASHDIYQRYAQHLNAPSTNSEKETWIANLKIAGLAPILVRLEENIEESLIRERERYWIHFYLSQGAPLTNIQHGANHNPPVVVEHDYCAAGEAARILSTKLGRAIRPDYISKLAKSKKQSIRSARFNDRILYHKEDIANCTITEKASSQHRKSA
jgi:hypothetical protein